jgi:hypothetical protein
MCSSHAGHQLIDQPLDQVAQHSIDRSHALEFAAVLAACTPCLCTDLLERPPEQEEAHAANQGFKIPQVGRGGVLLLQMLWRWYPSRWVVCTALDQPLHASQYMVASPKQLALPAHLIPSLFTPLVLQEGSMTGAGMLHSPKT